MGIALLMVGLGALFVQPTSGDQRAFGLRVAAAALDRTTQQVTYDPTYRSIEYPGGDIPGHLGVCSDVVVRALRKVGIDLQKRVHEDMKANFDAYPDHWGLSRPDPNIDHRRVPNLERYFTRIGARQTAHHDLSRFHPGDIVAWNLKGATGGWLAHIGVVSAQIGPTGRPLVVHNIGEGPKAEDVLFAWPMTGHYRITPSQ
ncbi:MAG: DUF1287 domain-containing protein [Pseudomonadota bacterium]